MSQKIQIHKTTQRDSRWRRDILKLQLAIIFLISVSVNSCSVFERAPKKMPDDFNFLAKYGYLYGYEVNTYQNTFTKSIRWNSDTLINFSFSDKQKSLIYKEIKRYRILNYPTDFIPTSRIKSIPAPSYYLKFTINGIEKVIIWETNTESDRCKATHLRKVFDVIVSFTKLDSTILKLPEDTRVLF
jgi:hypothetical protein